MFQGKFADFNITGLVPQQKSLLFDLFIFLNVFLFFDLGPFKQISWTSKVLVTTSVFSPCFYSKNVATYKLTPV